MRFRRNIFIPFTFGSIIYPIIEILYRGRTHISMAIVGGIGFCAIYFINKNMQRSKYLLKVLFSAAFITEIEFLSGCLVNIIMKLNVWDYTDMKFNILGQICPLFSLYWCGMSAILVVIADMMLLFYEIKDKGLLKTEA